VDSLSALIREVAALKSKVSQRPLITKRGGGTQSSLILQVIGGHLISGVDTVRYAATLTPSKAWDPEVDTTGYDAGLGRAWLFVDGVMRPTRVLVRHDWSAHPRPLISGQRIQTHGTVTLTYDPGGGGTVVTMAAYTPSWA